MKKWRFSLSLAYKNPVFVPAGRPTKYKPSFNKKATQLCLLGLTDVQIAEFFDVAESTIYEWKLQFPKFSEAMNKGKVDADLDVVTKLRKRALGYKYKEITYERTGLLIDLQNEDGTKTQQPEYRKRVVVKDLAPDVLAIHLWLKNRQPTLWRDRKEIDHKLNGPVSFIYNEAPGNQPLEDEDAPQSPQ